MNRRLFWIVPCLALTMVIALAPAAGAATVTKQVLVNFGGSLTGTAYTLGPGELDNSFSFASNGSASISGGVADLPGSTDLTSGFYFDGPSLGLGSLQTVNWISEAVMSLDVPVAQQPDGPGGEGDDYNHFLDVRGDLFYRFNGDGQNPKITQFGYWNGSTEPSMTTSDPSANQMHHVAPGVGCGYEYARSISGWCIARLGNLGESVRGAQPECGVRVLFQVLKPRRRRQTGRGGVFDLHGHV